MYICPSDPSNTGPASIRAVRATLVGHLGRHSHAANAQVFGSVNLHGDMNRQAADRARVGTGAACRAVSRTAPRIRFCSRSICPVRRPNLDNGRTLYRLLLELRLGLRFRVFLCLVCEPVVSGRSLLRLRLLRHLSPGYRTGFCVPKHADALQHFCLRSGPHRLPA